MAIVIKIFSKETFANIQCQFFSVNSIKLEFFNLRIKKLDIGSLHARSDFITQ